MIVSLVVAAVAFYIGAYLLSGVQMKSFVESLIVAVLVAVLDFTLGNVLKIVTLGILSLGIFTWLLNAVLIQVADWFLPGFKVNNFWWALALAAIVSIASGVITSVTGLG